MKTQADVPEVEDTVIFAEPSPTGYDDDDVDPLPWITDAVGGIVPLSKTDSWHLGLSPERTVDPSVPMTCFQKWRPT